MWQRAGISPSRSPCRRRAVGGNARHCGRRPPAPRATGKRRCSRGSAWREQKGVVGGRRGRPRRLRAGRRRWSCEVDGPAPCRTALATSTALGGLSGRSPADDDERACGWRHTWERRAPPPQRQLLPTQPRTRHGHHAAERYHPRGDRGARRTRPPPGASRRRDLRENAEAGRSASARLGSRNASRLSRLAGSECRAGSSRLGPAASGQPADGAVARLRCLLENNHRLVADDSEGPGVGHQ